MLLRNFSHRLKLGNLHLFLTLLRARKIIKTNNLLPIVFNQVAGLLRRHPGLSKPSVPNVSGCSRGDQDLLLERKVVDTRRLLQVGERLRRHKHLLLVVLVLFRLLSFHRGHRSKVFSLSRACMFLRSLNHMVIAKESLWISVSSTGAISGHIHMVWVLLYQ